MAPIVTSVEIARPPEEVFGYVIDPSRFVEWQEGVVSGRMEGDGPHGVGSRCISTRRIGGGERASTAEITEFDPPNTVGRSRHRRPDPCESERGGRAA
jgi:uncharacterized protein YndB with AHSA1/START domain